ncbi:hypothetical protein ACQKDY_19765, partial [Alteromonas macleodii]|uniref:hypothetical protein n=1 Tax=Alteromonas macleodii TaxID=28108 RepID=UPI003D02085E
MGVTSLSGKLFYIVQQNGELIQVINTDSQKKYFHLLTHCISCRLWKWLSSNIHCLRSVVNFYDHIDVLMTRESSDLQHAITFLHQSRHAFTPQISKLKPSDTSVSDLKSALYAVFGTFQGNNASNFSTVVASAI